MPAFDRLLNSNILGDAWQQILSGFREGRIGQLISMKPIEVYNTTLPYDLDGAHIEVELKAYVENILQKRFQNAISILTFDFSSLGHDVMNYDCHVSVKVNMDYENMGLYLNQQFANKPFSLFEGKLELTILSFKLNYTDKLVSAEIPLKIKATHKKLKHTGFVTVLAKGKIRYQPALYKISVVDISYVAQTRNVLIKGANLIYYRDVINALEDFLQFNIKDELHHGLQLAQGKIDVYNKETPLVQGEIETLELERIELQEEKATGIFLAEGKIKLTP